MSYITGMTNDDGQGTLSEAVQAEDATGSRDTKGYGIIETAYCRAKLNTLLYE